MKTYRAYILSAILVSLGGTGALAQTNTLSTVSIGTAVTSGGTANGVATIVQRIGTAGNQPASVQNNLAGIQYVAGQIPLTGAPASVVFYALSGAAIPAGGGPASAFTSYGTLTSPTNVVTYSDVASKLTSNSYIGLTFSAADLGFGSSNFYTIHHAPNNVDYWAEIVPGTGTSSSVADLKPMSWPGVTTGGPASPGSNGYFGLAWATGILSAGAPYADQSMYYLRTDVSNHTKFGVMIPALTGASTDTLDLTTAVGSYGVGGYTTLAFSPSAIGNYGANQFYYLRLDPITGYTVLGRLNPSLIAGTRTISDIANLGGVFNSLSFAFDATGPAGAWGTVQFYATGAILPGAQSISFEAIPDHNVGDVFNVTPTASSGLDIDVTVVSGPATISQTGVSGANPSGRIFTITTTAPGIVKLQARQAGQLAVPAYTANLLQQSFNVLGLPSITSANSAPGTVGTPFTFSITATGSPTSYAASPLPAGLSLNTATGAITGTPSAAAVTVVSVTATNATGTSPAATLTITVSTAGATPVITSPTTAAGTVGSAFSYNITATGAPTSFTASPLPAGLSVSAATGAITGTPTASGSTVATLTATNASGTSAPVSLTITIGALGAKPTITSANTAPGTVGTAFVTYTIQATNSPTSFTASGLPAGLTLNLGTGAINGTPTAAGSSVVALGATNAIGTGTATLTITVAGAGTAPIITSPTSSNIPGTVGSTFNTYAITATGLPTSYSASSLPPGLTLDPLTGLIAGTPTAAGTYVETITATNSSGSGSATVVFAIADAATAPIITSPTTGTGSVNTPIATFPITATGLPTSYTATGLPPGLTLDPLTGQINGTPTTAGTFVATITATNSFGTTTVTITWVIAPFGFSHIVNFSARALSGPGAATLIVGFVVSGDGKNLMVRGVGPGLAPFGITNFLVDPTLTLYGSNGGVLDLNDNWQTTSTGQNDGALIAATAASVGAFALADGSKDSALIETLNNGVHTTGLLTPNSATGVGLIEIYDIGGNPYSHLINVSARMNVTAGDGVLIAGVVIGGNAPKMVLIRGVGPALAQYGVSGVLSDPLITVYSGSTWMGSNSGWDTGTTSATDMTNAFVQAGAFPLPAGSKDAALLIMLQPGAYTVQVTSRSNSTGVALIEVYDTQ